MTPAEKRNIAQALTLATFVKGDVVGREVMRDDPVSPRSPRPNREPEPVPKPEKGAGAPSPLGQWVGT